MRRRTRKKRMKVLEKVEASEAILPSDKVHFLNYSLLITPNPLEFHLNVDSWRQMVDKALRAGLAPCLAQGPYIELNLALMKILRNGCGACFGQSSDESDPLIKCSGCWVYFHEVFIFSILTNVCVLNCARRFSIFFILK